MLAGAGITAFAMGAFYKAEYIPPAEKDELIAETVRLKNAEIKSREQIIQVIKEDNAEMASTIEEQEERILSYTHLELKLKTFEDSLQTLRSRLSLTDVLITNEDGSMAFRDTTMTEYTTYNNQLFGVTCGVTFSKSGCISLFSDLEQIRPTKVSLTNTEPVPGYIYSYVYLEDFDQQESIQFTYQPEPERERKPFLQRNGKTMLYTAAGVVIIIKTIEAIF